MRIVFPTCVNNVLALVARYRRGYHGEQRRDQVVPSHEDAYLLALMPEHADGPNRDVSRNNLSGAQQLFPAMLVRPEGERIFNEEIVRNAVFAANAISRQVSPS